MSLRVRNKKREKEEQKKAEQHVIVGKKTYQTAPVLDFFLCFFFFAPAGRGSIIGEALSLGAC